MPEPQPHFRRTGFDDLAGTLMQGGFWCTLLVAATYSKTDFDGPLFWVLLGIAATVMLGSGIALLASRWNQP